MLVYLDGVLTHSTLPIRFDLLSKRGVLEGHRFTRRFSAPGIRPIQFSQSPNAHRDIKAITYQKYFSPFNLLSPSYKIYTPPLNLNLPNILPMINPRTSHNLRITHTLPAIRRLAIKQHGNLLETVPLRLGEQEVRDDQEDAEEAAEYYVVPPPDVLESDGVDEGGDYEGAVDGEELEGDALAA